MIFERRMLSSVIICILVLPVLTSVIPQNKMVKAQSADSAAFTGNVYDVGRDTDGDGKYDYLEVAFEINVSAAAVYQIEVDYLTATQGTFSVYIYKSDFLNAGAQFFNVSVFASRIYVNRINATGVSGIWLRDQYWNQIDYLSSASFSRTYLFTDFDCRAALTGVIHDSGKDTDGNGLFDTLEIGVEINVTDAATYVLSLWDLYGNVSVSTYQSYQGYLDPGLQAVNISVNGLRLRYSGGYVSTVGSISLDVIEKDEYSMYDVQLQILYNVMLDRSYNYYEFDQAAFFTGKVLDKGIDNDLNGLFDYLEVNVEVNVTEANDYSIQLQNLVSSKIPGNYSNYMSVSQSYEGYLGQGLHLINFSIYGPEIYGARVSPTHVERLSLLCLDQSWGWFTVDGRYLTPLSQPYNYTQFESHAFLTGAVHDRGLDLNDDGLYDNLVVGVEINVTKAGTYELSVDGLYESDVNRSMQVDYYIDRVENLGFGIHVLNFTFPGQMIAYYHLNPNGLMGIRLAETSMGKQLDYTSGIGLSRSYSYTEFNTPMNDMHVELTIYPNATVGIGGWLNYTRMYPKYQYDYSPSANATIEFSTVNDVTTGFANGTVKIPRNMQQQWPYNSSTADFRYQYQNGILEAQLNATVPAPPSFYQGPIIGPRPPPGTSEKTAYPFNSSDFSLSATYSGQILQFRLQGQTELPSAASGFPYNISDVAIIADYKGNDVVGNITFHTISGFPLGDVITTFEGNRTEMLLTGFVNIIYGTYSGTVFNETSVEDMLTQINSTIPGKGPSSLYQGTGGILECTTLNTTRTPIVSPFEGSRIDFRAAIEGNFTKLLAQYASNMLFGYYASNETRSSVYAGVESALNSVSNGSVVLNYYYGSKIGSIDILLSGDAGALWANAMELVPPTIPEEYRSTAETWLKIANVTAYAIQHATIRAGYSSEHEQFDLYASLVANITQIKNATLALLPEALPSNAPIGFRDLIVSCTNITYCKLDSSNASVQYINGEAIFNVSWLIKDDFSAQLNHLKSCYIRYLNLTAPWAINWQTRMLNSTWIDASNLKAELREGGDWETLSFGGIRVNIAKDELGFIQFRLQKLFNITSGYSEPPREFEKLSVKIVSGFNETHTVLLYVPDTVPTPNEIGFDYKTATWDNITMSSMKDLIFRIAFQGTVHYLGGTFYVPIFSNSTIYNFGFDPVAKRISFNVTGTLGTGFANVTIPKALLYADSSQWIISIDGSRMANDTFSIKENSEYVFIYFNYTHSTHKIEIEGTSVVTEFPLIMLPLLLITLWLVIAVAIHRERRKNVRMKWFAVQD